MPHTYDLVKEMRIDDAAGLAVARGRADLGDFLRVFLARGASEDIALYTPAELLELADAAMQDLSRRTVGHHRVSVFNPRTTIPPETPTAPSPWSRSSTTTCRSWSTRCCRS
jgi:glutamate dehydrogenase